MHELGQVKLENYFFFSRTRIELSEGIQHIILSTAATDKNLAFIIAHASMDTYVSCCELISYLAMN